MERYDFLDIKMVIYYMMEEMSNLCEGKGELGCAEKNLEFLIRVRSKTC
jgi:hypothetical protein